MSSWLEAAASRRYPKVSQITVEVTLAAAMSGHWERVRAALAAVYLQFGGIDGRPLTIDTIPTRFNVVVQTKDPTEAIHRILQALRADAELDRRITFGISSTTRNNHHTMTLSVNDFV